VYPLPCSIGTFRFIAMQQKTQQEVFQALIQQHTGLLYKVATLYCHNAAERQDLLQDIQLQIWLALPRYNPAFKMSTWLYRIALNVSISHWRKSAVRQKNTTELFAAADYPAASEETTTESEQQFQSLLSAIHALKPLDKALMVLYMEGKSHAEIAEILGISVSNTGTRIGRVKDQLKKQLSQTDGDF
jgi:RNA polymerase sigma factor (sigma-70 family)